MDCIVHRVTKSRTQLSDFRFTICVHILTHVYVYIYTYAYCMLIHIRIMHNTYIGQVCMLIDHRQM